MRRLKIKSLTPSIEALPPRIEASPPRIEALLPSIDALPLRRRLKLKVVVMRSAPDVRYISVPQTLPQLHPAHQAPYHALSVGILSSRLSGYRARAQPGDILGLAYRCPLCATCPAVGSEPRDAPMDTQLCKPDFRSLSCQRFPSMKFNSTLCMGAPETSFCHIKCSRSSLS